MWWFLGSLGIVAIEASYVPQIVRLFRLRRADEVSLFFPSLNAFGRVLALAYSILSHQPVFIVGFIVGLILRCTLLLQVIVYRSRNRLGNGTSKDATQGAQPLTSVALPSEVTS